MKLFRAAIITIAAGSACTGKATPGRAQEGTATPHIETQAPLQLRSDAPFDVVVQQFKLQDPRAMRNAVTQLATMRVRSDVAALLNDAWHGNRRAHADFNWTAIETPAVRLAIAGVLGEWSTDKAEYHSFAMSQLNSPDWTTRVDAVFTLGEIGEPRDIELLEKVAMSGDELAAAAALAGLQIMGTPESLRVIEAVMEDPKFSEARRRQARAIVRFAAGAARTGEATPGRAQEGTESPHIEGQAPLLLRSDAPFDVVAQQFKLQDPRAMRNAVAQLAAMRNRSDVAALLNDAWHGDRRAHADFNWTAIETPTVRLAIAGVLGEWSTDKTEYHSFAMSQLNSPDWTTRVDAVFALGEIGEPRDVALLEKLAMGGDELAAAAALAGLQIMGTPESLRVIEAVMKDPKFSEARRRQAREVLALPRGPK